MKQRFLKALGYLSTYGRPESVDEAIQMHADTLYHRMLAQERAVASAKAEGLPEPQFPPILPSSSLSSSQPTTTTTTTTTTSIPKDPTTAATPPPVPAPAPAASKKDDLPPLRAETRALLTPASQAALRERLKGMTATEREVEERGVVIDAEAAKETGKQVSDIMAQRKKRREEGNATMGDMISGWFGR